MKKLFQFAAVAMVATLFVNCQGDVSPETSSTKLWPAANKDGSKWGYIDQEGTDLVIEAQYGMTCEFSCKRGVVTNLSGSEYYVIDAKGKEIPTDALKEGTDGWFYYDCLRFTSSSGNEGMIDVDGNLVFPDDYPYLGRMSSSKLAVFAEKNGNKYLFGYLKKGEKHDWISAKYDMADRFVDDVAVVMEGEEFGVISTEKGGKYLDEWKLTDKYQDISCLGEKRIGYWEKDADACGLKDLSGEKHGSAKFKQIQPFTDSKLARVRNDEKRYGYINPEGEVVIRCKYVAAYSFYEGVAWVREEEGNWKLIDTNGEQLFKLREDDSPQGNYHNGLCMVLKGGNFKYINKEGEAVDYTWTVGGGPEPDDAPARNRGLKTDAEMMASTAYGPLFENARMIIGD